MNENRREFVYAFRHIEAFYTHSIKFVQRAGEYKKLDRSQERLKVIFNKNWVQKNFYIILLKYTKRLCS